MKTDRSETGSDSQTSEKTTRAPWKRAGGVGLTILNPFSDLGVIYRKGVKPTVGRTREAFAFWKSQSASTELLDWAQAVERSGKTAEQLATNFRRIKICWWSLMMLCGGIALMLLAMMLMNLDLPGDTLMRVAKTILLLAIFAGVAFVKALTAVYRLWQLQTRRVSESEGGTFKDFLSQNKWLRLVLIF
jgi:hypothetical protein